MVKRIRVPKSIEDSIALRKWIVEYAQSNFSPYDFEICCDIFENELMLVTEISRVENLYPPSSELMIPKCDTKKFRKSFNSKKGVGCEYNSYYEFENEDEVTKT
jgi:hypothetical protein